MREYTYVGYDAKIANENEDAPILKITKSSLMNHL